MNNEMKKRRDEERRSSLLLSPLLLSCRTHLPSNASAVFSIHFDKFLQLRAAHYRPNVPWKGSDHPGATSPWVEVKASAQGQEIGIARSASSIPEAVEDMN